MGLIQKRAGRWHLRVFEDRIPARFLVLEPSPDALPVGLPCDVGDVVYKVTEPLSQGHHTQTLALSYPVEQGVELRTERLTHWRRNRRQFLWDLEKGVTQTEADTHSRKQGPQTLRRAVEAVGEDPFDAVRWLVLQGGALKLAIGLRKGNCTGLRSNRWC
jgi:hypothetical protein